MESRLRRYQRRAKGTGRRISGIGLQDGNGIEQKLSKHGRFGASPRRNDHDLRLQITDHQQGRAPLGEEAQSST
ncbi:hypothetical protein EYF80_029808 [Liparis tanakae]|uniref:Uncharacterized protein n=1 Tax=Liparis tanakae TaxID=230148 RepID=A0A4Z2H2E5_9TELE|nr:hypothetical protein EYF80_029808 [Liparis tanakae]